MRRSLALSLACAVGAATSTAHATPSFPGVIASHLGASKTPDCSLCHTGTPSRATVTTPFGNTIRSRGAKAYDEASLRTALDALSAEKKDSDGDGTSDIDELRAGESPNSAGASEITPEYGCAASPVAAPGGLLVAVAAACALALGARRRRVR